MESRADARDQRQVMQRRVKLLRRLPWYDVLSEIRTAARKLHSSYNFSIPRPVCSVKLSLECPNPEEPRRGLLHCKVGLPAVVKLWQLCSVFFGATLLFVVHLLYPASIYSLLSYDLLAFLRLASIF